MGIHKPTRWNCSSLVIEWITTKKIQNKQKNPASDFVLQRSGLYCMCFMNCKKYSFINKMPPCQYSQGVKQWELVSLHSTKNQEELDLNRNIDSINNNEKIQVGELIKTYKYPAHLKSYTSYSNSCLHFSGWLCTSCLKQAWKNTYKHKKTRTQTKTTTKPPKKPHLSAYYSTVRKQTGPL